MKKKSNYTARSIAAAAVCIVIAGCIGVNAAAVSRSGVSSYEDEKNVISNENMFADGYAGEENVYGVALNASVQSDEDKCPWDSIPYSETSETSTRPNVFEDIPFKWDVTTTTTAEQVPQSIILDKSSITMNVGDYEYLSYTAYPVDTYDVVFKSSNKSVASVDVEGYIHAVAPGTATITALYKFNANVTAECVVTVNGADAESISLNKGSLEMKKGDRTSLSYTIQPADAKAEVSWSSSNQNVVSVDGSGNLYARSSGSAVIKVSTDNGKSASCNVTVTTPVESITLSKHSTTLKAGETEQLSYTINPNDADNKTVKWTSSDTSAVTVDSNGMIKGIKAGSSAQVTVTAEGGISDSITVKVDGAEPTSITLDKTELTMYVGYKATLVPTVLPENIPSSQLEWSTTNANVVSVSNGTLTAKKEGTAKIGVSTANGKTAYCTVTVKKPDPNSVTLSKTELTMYVGDTETLKATVLPKDASSDNLAWSTSNTNVVSVSDGVITAKKEGTAKIGVSTTNGKTAYCTVTVKKHEPESITLSETTLTMYAGDTATLKAAVLPEEASSDTLAWSTSNTYVVSVSKGVLTAKKEGTAKIMVRTTNDKTATCVVTVKPAEAKSVSLNNTSLSIKIGETSALTASVSPSTASRNVTWSSSNSSVAAVSGSGIVTGKSAGSAVITAKTSNGKTAECKVTVMPVDVTSISLNVTEKILNKNAEITLYAVVTPSNATDKTVKWSSSNASVASVDQNGKVTGKSSGTAVITASSDNGKTASCKIIVPDVAVTGVSIIGSTTTVKVGETISFTAEVYPSNALDKSVEWYAHNENDISVDQNGNVTGLVAGKTLLGVRTANGKTSSRWITVEPISDLKVNFDPRSQSVELGDTVQLKFDPLPEGKKVTFRSGDPSAVSVDDQGRVTGLKVKQVVVSAVVDGNESLVYVQVKSNEEMRLAARRRYAEEVLYYVNIEREKAGVPPLELMDDLSYLAQIRSEEQVADFKAYREKYKDTNYVYVSHTRPDGRPWTTVFENASIKRRAQGENLLQGYGVTPKSAVQRWMNSAGHRANILRPNFTHMGVGVVLSNIDVETGAPYGMCVTQLFIEQ